MMIKYGLLMKNRKKNTGTNMRPEADDSEFAP